MSISVPDSNENSDEMLSLAGLTDPQLFRLEVLRRDIDKLTLAQAKDYLIQLLVQQMLRDNVYNHFLKNKP